MGGRQYLACRIVGFRLGLGPRQLLDQLDQREPPPFVKAAPVNERLHHLADLVHALQQRLGHQRRALEGAHAQALQHVLQSMHEFGDAVGAAVGEIPLDRVHVAERTRHQVDGAGHAHELVQVVFEQRQMLPDLVYGVRQQFEIDVLVFHVCAFQAKNGSVIRLP